MGVPEPSLHHAGVEVPFTVLVVNPGSTSTKLALWAESGVLREATLGHEVPGQPIGEQFAARLAAVRAFLAEAGSPVFDAVVGRGGPLRPLEGGSYRIDAAMLDDLAAARWGEHASLLGGRIAQALAAERDLPALVVDPVSVDELDAVARISGVPEITRLGRSHALNLKAVCRLAAESCQKPLAETRFAAAHLGGGISVAVLRGGRIVDVNDALLGMGPFSPHRAGALPLRGLLDLAFAPGATRGTLETKLRAESGLFAYLGTGDLKEVESRIEAGDDAAAAIFAAMRYQIVKELGAMAAALEFRLDGFILTGGMSRSERLVGELRERLTPLAPCFVYAGEHEMEALAKGAFRVLRGEEPAKSYSRNGEAAP